MGNEHTSIYDHRKLRLEDDGFHCTDCGQKVELVHEPMGNEQEEHQIVASSYMPQYKIELDQIVTSAKKQAAREICERIEEANKSDEWESSKNRFVSHEISDIRKEYGI